MGVFMETVKSIGRGDILLRMRVDKLFPYILYTFALAVISIWLSYKAEITMQKVEKNKATPVPGILQARTLEWVAISFSNA